MEPFGKVGKHATGGDSPHTNLASSDHSTPYTAICDAASLGAPSFTIVGILPLDLVRSPRRIDAGSP